MSFLVPENAQLDIPRANAAEAGFGDRFSASYERTALEMDSWHRRARTVDGVIGEIESVAGKIEDPRNDRTRGRRQMSAEQRIALALQRAGETQEGAAGRIPITREAFDARVAEILQNEYQEQSEILDAAPDGAWAAEILGMLAAGATDESTVMTLPLGGVAGFGGKTALTAIGRAAAAETALSMGAELQSIGRQQDMAETLGIDPVNPVQQVLTQGAVGGVLGGALGGLGYALTRGFQYRADLTMASEREREAGLSFGQDLDAAAAELPLPTAARTSADGAPVPGAPEPIDVAPYRARFPEQNSGTLIAFARLERLSGRELKVISHFRAPEHNARVGGARNSQHTHGNAWDIDVRDMSQAERQQLIWDARRAGFRGIGVYNNTIHFDVGPTRHWGPDHSAGSLPGWARAFVGGPLAQDAPIPVRVEGAGSTSEPFTPTTRSYTRDGQVRAGATRVSVQYEVVDASDLTPASGALQPRDRTAASSDEQVAQIASQLDPALLAPWPEADRGAPVVGPDGIVESGNGRVMAISRAAELYPDRFGAYRAQIEAWGFDVPEGVERPILVARRTSNLTPDQRREFVVAANDRTTAAMPASERAMADAPRIQRDTLALYDPASKMNGNGNARFRKALLDVLPQAERAGLVDKKGRLNADGLERLQQTLFARAFDAPDITERLIGTELAGFRNLAEGLRLASPSWAQMRAEIDAGRIPAQFDVTDQLNDALRMILRARETADASDLSFAGALSQALDQVDMLEGAVDPVQAGFVRFIAEGGKIASTDDVARLLRGYADQVMREGQAAGDFLAEAPAPGGILEQLAPKAFDVPEGWAPPASAIVEPAPMPQASELAAFDNGAFGPETFDVARAEIEAEVTVGPDLRAQVTDAARVLSDVDETRQLRDELLDDAMADIDALEVIDLCPIPGGRG